MRDQIGNIEPKTNAVEAAIKKYDREMEEHVSGSESKSEEDDDDEPNATSSRERISAAAKAAASKDIKYVSMEAIPPYGTTGDKLEKSKKRHRCPYN